MYCQITTQAMWKFERFVAVAWLAWQGHRGWAHLAAMRLFKPGGCHGCLQDFGAGGLGDNKIIFCITDGFPTPKTSTLGAEMLNSSPALAGEQMR